MVVLHGWGDSGAGWQPFAAELAKEYQVIVPDLPGFGGTEMPPVAWNVIDYAMFVRDFLQKIDVAPYAIVGHSNGGAIAIRALGQGLLQAEKLLLIGSAGVRSPRSNQTIQVIAKVGKVVSRPLPRGVRRRLRETLYQKSGSDLLVAAHMQETFKKIVRDDVRADAAYLSLPTLLLYGADDTETPVEIGELLHAAVEGSHLEVVADAGHFVHRDAEKAVIDRTKEFLHA